LREPAARAAGHDTATLKAFQVSLAEPAAVGAGLPSGSPYRFLTISLAISLRLNAKRGIVMGLDADDWVRIRD
jgi:hypothetical protein